MNRLHKEGSNADEPTNINLSDYSSDEGDISSSSSNSGDEIKRGGNRDDCCPPLRVPPPSPVLPRREHKSSGRRSKGTSNYDRSSTPLRTMYKVNQTTIDIDIPTTDVASDICEPATELESDSSYRQSSKNIKTVHGLKCSERCDMPPELIVTTAQVYDTQIAEDLYDKLTLNDTSDEPAQLVRPSTSNVDLAGEKHRNQTWHHLRCVPLPKSAQRTVTDLNNELQNKIGSSLRQKIWTGIPCVCHSSDTDTHWSKPMKPTLQEQNPSTKSIEIAQIDDAVKNLPQSSYSEHLLKTCSEKLEHLQKKEHLGNVHKLRKSTSTKKYKTTSIKKTLLTSTSLDERVHKLKNIKSSSLSVSMDSQNQRYWRHKEFNMSLFSESGQRKSDSQREKTLTAMTLFSDDDDNEQEGKSGILKALKLKKKIKGKGLNANTRDLNLKKSHDSDKKGNGKELSKLEGSKHKKVREDIQNKNAVETNQQIDQNDIMHNVIERSCMIDHEYGESFSSEVVEENQSTIHINVEESNETFFLGEYHTARVEYCTESPINSKEEKKKMSDKKKHSLKWKFCQTGLIATAVANSKKSTGADGIETGKNAKKKRESNLRKIKPKRVTSAMEIQPGPKKIPTHEKP